MDEDNHVLMTVVAAVTANAFVDSWQARVVRHGCFFDRHSVADDNISIDTIDHIDTSYDQNLRRISQRGRCITYASRGRTAWGVAVRRPAGAGKTQA